MIARFFDVGQLNTTRNAVYESRIAVPDLGPTTTIEAAQRVTDDFVRRRVRRTTPEIRNDSHMIM